MHDRGNIANNSGGPHTLKYGVTVNHILGLEVVMPDGEIVWLGGKTRETQGYDLTGVFVGSEGTLHRKVNHILATGAEAVVTANPGCILQIQAGLRAHGAEVSVLHIVEVLDRAGDAAP